MLRTEDAQRQADAYAPHYVSSWSLGLGFYPYYGGYYRAYVPYGPYYRPYYRPYAPFHVYGGAGHAVGYPTRRFK